MQQELTPCSWFAEWREPRFFFLTAWRSGLQFKAYEFLGRPGLQYLREAYVAGLFARIYNDHRPCKVRLVCEEFPDAEILEGADTLRLEIVLADKQGRQIAKEHRILNDMRQIDPGWAIMPADSPDVQRGYALQAIPHACSQKAMKYLGTSKSARNVNADLLVAANFSTILGVPLLSDDEMANITEPWSKNFNAIWVLLGTRIARVWPSPLAMSAVNDPLG